MKKIIATSMLTLMILDVLVMSVFATGTGTLSAGNVTGNPGDTVIVDVSMPTNPGLITMKIVVSYGDDLELISVSNAGLLNGWVNPSPTIVSPYTLFWKDALSTTNNTATGIIVTLIFKIKPSVTIGTKEICINFTESRGANGQKNTFSSASSTVTVVCNHSFTEKNTDAKYLKSAATCSEKAVYFYSCSLCGEVGSSIYEYGDALGHTSSEWIIDKAPTCTLEGSRHKECTVCHEVLETESMEALGHDIQHHEGKVPICTEIGWNAYDTCSRCEYTTYVELPALGHTSSEWIIDKTPTCTLEGSRHKECTG